MIDQETYFNPFPGLRSFEEDEEYLFFGREKQIDDLLDRLEETHFLAVIGTSGSGKSSLVKSGLLPSLHTGFIKGSGKGWRIGVFRPGDDPIGNLASCLSGSTFHVKNEEGEDFDLQPVIESVLRRSEQGIVNTVDQLLNTLPENILLVVDQFEELFRFSKYEKTSYRGTRDAVLFVNLLLDAVKDKTRRLYVIFTMRSDFIGNCTVFRGLPEAMSAGQYLIPRMTRNEIQLAITGPVAVSGAQISSQLVSMLLNEVGDNLDQLPILQHALMRTYAYWNEHSNKELPITIEHYQSIGKMELALSYHANEAYHELTEDQKILCAALFKGLTETGTVSGGIRRPTKLAELCELLAVDKNALIPIINAFRKPGRSFLMPPFEVELNDDSVIDISHESLMRVWVRLVDWFKEEMNSAETYLKLCKDAESYQDGKGSLLTNPELAITLKWREKQHPTEEWGARYDLSFVRAMNFLDQSKENNDFIIEQKELSRKYKLKKTKRILAAVSVLFFVAVVAALFAYTSMKQAEEAQQSAENERQVAERAREDAEDARKGAEDAKEKAEDAQREEEKAKKKAEKARGEEEKAKEEAVEQREIAQEQKQEADKQKEKAEKQKKYAQDQRKKAEAEQQKADSLRRISDARRIALEAIKKFDTENSSEGVKLATKAYDTLPSSGKKKRYTEIYSALNRALRKFKTGTSLGHSCGLKLFAKHPKLNKLVFIDMEGNVYKHTIDKIKLIKNSDPEVRYSSLKYTNDEEYLILGTDQGTVQILNNENKVINTQTFENKISEIYVTTINSANHVLIFEKDHIHFMKLDKGNLAEQSKVVLSRLNTKLRYISKDFSRMVISQDSTAFVYSIEINQGQMVLRDEDPIKTSSLITSVEISSNNKYLALGMKNGSIHLSLLRNQNRYIHSKTVPSHKSAVSSVKFHISNDESLLFSSSYDNTINVTNIDEVDNYAILNGHQSWIRQIEISNDRKQIISISEDKTLRYWFIDTEDIIKRLNETKN